MIKQFSSYQIAGRGRAKTLGFPTINLKIPTNFYLKTGIYGVYILLNGLKYLGAMHYGMSPTFSDTEKSLEVFLIDTKNISSFDQKINIQIIKYLRPVINFSSKIKLIKQIKEDVIQIKKFIFLSTLYFCLFS